VLQRDNNRPCPQSAIRNPQSAIRGWRIWYLLAAFGIYMVDQMSKAWAVRTLRLGQDKTVITAFLDFSYAENPGVAFGQLQDGGAWGRWALAALACAAGIAVLTYFFPHAAHDDRSSGAWRASPRRHRGQPDGSPALTATSSTHRASCGRLSLADLQRCRRQQFASAPGLSRSI
jgi:hypothetical protein